jgi:hypothetical protein
LSQLGAQCVSDLALTYIRLDFYRIDSPVVFTVKALLGNVLKVVFGAENKKYALAR